jgi:ABC-2 type transport system ATP-binding protein
VDETPIIRLDGVVKEFDGVRALDGLSLEVRPGAIFGFLGPNGAGKTTTINVLLGLIAADQGTARILGLDTVTQGDQVRAKVGALLDETGLYPQMSCYENLAFYARVWHLDPGRIENALAEAGLTERRDDLASTLSRGMSQRLALARARLHDPEILFLDEPTAGLDVMAAREVRQSLRTAADNGVSIFLTTHNMTEAEELCERVAVIREGRLLAEAEPNALLAMGGHEVLITGTGLGAAVVEKLLAREDVLSAVASNGRLRLRMSNDDPAGVVAELVRLGASVSEVSRGSRLEDAFVELMGETQ